MNQSISINLRKLVFAILVALIATGPSYGQNSPGQKLAPEISKIVRLKWVGDRMGIDRDHWEEGQEEKTDQEKEEEEIAKLVKRGLPKEAAQRMIQQRRGFGGMLGTSTPVGKLFESLQSAAGTNSNGRSGGGNETQWRAKARDIRLRMVVGQSEFRLSIRETDKPFREFLIEEHDGKGLKIQIDSIEQTMVFWQLDDGTIRVASLSDGQNQSFEVGNYEEFVSEHPTFAADFWGQLKSYGVSKIMLGRDPQVIKGILALLKKPEPGSLEGADAAISQLGSDEYKVRTAAKKRIEENYPAWKSRIQQELKKPDLDGETSISLRNIVTLANEKSPESDVDRFIRENNLLDDSTYLSSIAADASTEEARELIEERVAELEK